MCRLIKKISFLVSCLFFLSACSLVLNVSSNSSDTLSGRISDLQTSSLGKMSSCVGEPIHLYEIKEDAIDVLIAETVVQNDGSYQFTDLVSKKIIIESQQSTKTDYLIEFICGSEVLRRFVTSATEQNLNFATTLISWLQETVEENKIKSITGDVWEDLYEKIGSAATIVDAQNQLNTNVEVQSELQSRFGVLPNDLENAAPVLRSATVPNTLSEEVVVSLVAKSYHWSPTYNLVYEWRLNSQLLSTSANYSYTPSANSQGQHLLQLFVGKDNGGGRVDTNKAYIFKTFNVTILDTVPVIAPVVTLLSSANTLSTNISLRLNTGSHLGNGIYSQCRSFSSFAILEDVSYMPLIPPQPSLFTNFCTQASQQDFNFTLSGAPGPRALQFWSIDANGNVSATPQLIHLFLDQQAPTINLFQINGGNSVSSGATLPLVLSANDNYSVNLQYRFGLSSNLSAEAWVSTIPINYSFPFTSGSYTLYVQVRDDFGNTSAVQASNTVDVVIGQPPVISLLSPSAGASFPTSGQSVDIQWKTDLPAGYALKTNPVRIFYSTDFGATKTVWSGGESLTEGTNNSCTLVPPATGCAALSLPVSLAATRFQIVIEVEDITQSVGVLLSQSMNTLSGLAHVAGNDSTVLGGSALATSINLGGGGGLTRDPVNGDIYVSRNCEVLRIDSFTGKVNRWAGHPTNCNLAGNGSSVSSTRFSNSTKLAVDSQRNIYWISNSGSIIWKYTHADGIARIIVGPVAGPFSGNSGENPLKYNGASISRLFVGKDNQLYFQKNIGNPCGLHTENSQIWKLDTINNQVIHLYGGGVGVCGGASNGDLAINTRFQQVMIIPGGGASEDYFIFQNTNTYVFNFYKTMADGTIQSVFVGTATGGWPRLFTVGSSRGILFSNHASGQIHQYNLNTNTYTPNIHTAVDADGAPIEVVQDNNGGFYYLTNRGNFISYVNSSNVRVIVAGIDPSYGDGLTARLAQLRGPNTITFDTFGNMYINDNSNCKIRKVNSSGLISTTISQCSNIMSNGITTDPVTNFLYGTTTSDGKGGRHTVKLSDKSCMFLCGNSGAPFLANQTSLLGPVSPYRGPSGPPNGMLADRFSFDGSNAWAHIEEFVETYSSTRHYIFKIDSSGNYTRIAGDHTLPSSTSHGLSDLQDVASTNAGSNAHKFVVRNDIMYFADGTYIHTGTQGGQWRRQVLACTGVQSKFTVNDSDNSIIYFCGWQMRKKLYQSDGLGADTLIVDFTGTFSSSSAPSLEYRQDEPNTVYFPVGNSVYKYTNATHL